MLARRSAVQTIATGAAGLLTGLPVRGETKFTAFAIIGDRYHNADYIRIALSKTLVRDLGLSIDFNDDVKALSGENLSSYKLLIIFRDGWIWPDGYPENMTYPGYAQRASAGIVSDPPVPKHEAKCVPWITAEQGKAVRDVATQGGSILFYHNVNYISPYSEDFRDVLGAVTQGHPPIRPFKVKVVNSEHPITRDVHDFVVTDEQHFVSYRKDPKYVLLRSVNKDGLAFTPPGRGRVTPSDAAGHRKPRHVV